jgi:hypothetical protein
MTLTTPSSLLCQEAADAPHTELPHSHPFRLRKARSLPIINLEESIRKAAYCITFGRLIAPQLPGDSLLPLLGGPAQVSLDFSVSGTRVNSSAMEAVIGS